jgi:selenocysteine lyase/cysteine desulfurase
MGDAVDFQMTIGKKNVEARVKQLATRVRSGIKDIPAVRSSRRCRRSSRPG